MQFRIVWAADMPAPCCARLRHVVNNRDVICNRLVQRIRIVACSNRFAILGRMRSPILSRDCMELMKNALDSTRQRVYGHSQPCRLLAPLRP